MAYFRFSDCWKANLITICSGKRCLTSEYHEGELWGKWAEKRTAVVFMHGVRLITALPAAWYGLYTLLYTAIRSIFLAIFPNHLILPYAHHPCTAICTVFGNTEFTRTALVAMLLAPSSAAFPCLAAITVQQRASTDGTQLQPYDRQPAAHFAHRNYDQYSKENRSIFVIKILQRSQPVCSRWNGYQWMACRVIMAVIINLWALELFFFKF